MYYTLMAEQAKQESDMGLKFEGEDPNRGVILDEDSMTVIGQVMKDEGKPTRVLGRINMPEPTMS